MELHKGDMWDVDGDYHIVTANNVVGERGDLVMGAGAAKQMLIKHPGIDTEFGTRINTIMKNDFYGVLIVGNTGVFQSKYHWRDPSDIDLIEKSATILRTVANTLLDKRFVMNFPGIGLGKLNRGEVEGVIESILPSNVIVCAL